MEVFGAPMAFVYRLACLRSRDNTNKLYVNATLTTSYMLKTKGPFLESPGSPSGPKSCLCLPSVHSRSKFQ